MDELRLPSALERCQRVLVAGAGGGFDVYAGLPLRARLRALGKEVFLANLSFTYLEGTNAKRLPCGLAREHALARDSGRLTPALYAIDAQTEGGEGYFPERTLARFLADRGDQTKVYAFPKTGVAPVREAYAYLARALSLDAIVLVDGGTDILLRGDEAGLGTPAEDMTSLAAVAGVDVPLRMIACVGFGVDAYHGVCHAQWLENVAALSVDGGFLGATALLERMPEVREYLDAVEHADQATPRRPSIVNGSVASAIEGRFGDHHRTERTRGSTLFVNPLMSLLWMFDLPAVARRNLYLDRLGETDSIWDVQGAIEAFRDEIVPRKRQAIPH
ncbi:MAG TPA: DUF1152 domain-containing protein [Polyangiaceae bacterium]|jgi:hypothetical protein